MILEMTVSYCVAGEVGLFTVSAMSATRSLYIVNNDNEAFTYSVVESSLYSAGAADHVVCTPMTATIPPHSRSVLSDYYLNLRS